MASFWKPLAYWIKWKFWALHLRLNPSDLWENVIAVSQMYLKNLSSIPCPSSFVWIWLLSPLPQFSTPPYWELAHMLSLSPLMGILPFIIHLSFDSVLHYPQKFYSFHFYMPCATILLLTHSLLYGQELCLTFINMLHSKYLWILGRI